MGRAGLSGGCRPLRNPTLTYYYARTSGGSPKRRHEPPMDAAGDGPVEDAGEDSRPGRAEVGGPRLQRGAQAEVRTMPLRPRSATACSSHVALAPSLPNSSMTNGTKRPPSARTRDSYSRHLSFSMPSIVEPGSARSVARYEDSCSRAMRSRTNVKKGVLGK